MGNMLITVHHRDGSVKYYNPPLCVMDILKEHPHYVVVSVSKGKTNILSSDLDLLPGGEYYMLSPDRLLSTTGDTEIMPFDHAYSNSYQNFAHFPPTVTIYVASSTSLFGVLIPCRRPKKAKSEMVSQQHEDLRADRRSGHETRLLMQNDGTEGKSPATMLTPGEKSTLKDLMVPEAHSPSSEKSTCCCPGLLKLFHWKAAKAAEQGITSHHGFSKEKWLEDMIRGADNQFRRVKLEQAFMLEDCKGESPYHVQSKPWRMRLPSMSQSPSTSFDAKPDENDLEAVTVLEDNQSQILQPPRKIQKSPDVEVHHYQQLEQQQDFSGGPARRDAMKELQLEIEQTSQEQLISQGVSVRRAAIKALESEIEQLEQLEVDKMGEKNKQTLRQKMDQMESQSLLGPSSPAGSARNVFSCRIDEDVL